MTERDRKCAEMRRQGHSWDEIAERLGYKDGSHAHDGFVRFIAKARSISG